MAPDDRSRRRARQWRAEVAGVGHRFRVRVWREPRVGGVREKRGEGNTAAGGLNHTGGHGSREQGSDTAARRGSVFPVATGKKMP